MKKYDIVIKSAPKDYFKLDLVIDSIKYLIPQPSKIYILTNDGYRPKNTTYDSIIECVMDSDVNLKIDKSLLRHRPNWNWVNLVSLFQNFTENDLYLDVQSDNFFVNYIDLFDENSKPKIFRSTINNNNVKGWKPYFDFSEKVFGIPKMSSGFSYIIEFLMYDKNHTKKLCEMYNSFDDMMEKIYQSIDMNSYPADQEIYGNLIEKYFSEQYRFVDDFPVHFTGTEGNPTYEEVSNYIKNVKSNLPNMYACSYHTWN